MTAFQNEERFCRKSSVYNQTGQTYFQQLSAYNHMSAHLRRVLLAPCIVDSRNKRYSRNKELGSARFSSRSKSLNKIRSQEDIIDGIAYDTQHHPLDVLRKSLECSPECRREIKEVGDACGRCNDWSARSRCGVTSCNIVQRIPINSAAGGTICQCLHLHPCKPCSTPALKRTSPKSSRLNGCFRRVRAPMITDRKERMRISASDRSKTIKTPPSRSKVEKSEQSYIYDSSFESSSENSTVSGSPTLKLSEINNRGSRSQSPVDIANEETNNKNSETAERSDEAKYAKFIYDITQEITINGLYNDNDLHAIFKKHIDMNCDTLDRNKMKSEIHRLMMALNVQGSSDDEEVNDIQRFTSTGKFARFSLEKTQTPSKIFDEYNVERKKLQNEGSIRFGEARRSKSPHGKSSKKDPNPELVITEQDVVITLKEMELDPHQIQTICKNLQKRSREISPQLPTFPYLKAILEAFDRSDTLNNSSICIGNIDESSFDQVKDYTETSSLKRGQIRSNSLIESKNGNRMIDSHHCYTDWKPQNVCVSPRKNQTWQCFCTDFTTAEELQAKFQPEIEIRSSPNRSRADRISIPFESSQLDEISEPFITKKSARSTESRKIYRASKDNEKQVMEDNKSHGSSLESKKLPQESLRTLTRLVSNKSLDKKKENHEEEKRGKMEKIHMQRTRMMQAENRSENDSPHERAKNKSDEEQERTSHIKMRTSSSMVQSGDRITDELTLLADSKMEFSKESNNVEIEKIPKTRNFDHFSPPNEEDIMFVSHSTFLNNLTKGDIGSLPDISERSEGITEDVAKDENMKNIREATSHRSLIDQVTDNKMINFSEQISQGDLISIDNELSEIFENIDAPEIPSLTDITEEKIVISETQELPANAENLTDKLSPFSILEDSGDSENDEDSDENQRVVVAASKPPSSPALMSKIALISSNPAVDKGQTAVADKTTLSPDLSPRMSENEDSKRIDESSKNSAKKKQLDEKYSVKMERRSSTADKSNDTSSIETELDQQETLPSTSEIQVKEEKFRFSSSATNSKTETENEENRKVYEFGQQETLHSTPEIQVKEEKFRVSNGARNSRTKNEDEENRKSYEFGQQETLHPTPEIQVKEEKFRVSSGARNSKTENEDKENRKSYEFGQQETLHPTPEIQVKEEKFRVSSGARNSKTENEDKENRKSYEFGQQETLHPTPEIQVKEEKFRVSSGARNSKTENEDKENRKSYEFGQQETLHPTPEIQVKEEKFRVSSGARNSKTENEDKENRKSYEFGQQETLHPTPEIQVKEEKFRVSSGARNSKTENEDEESRKFYELAEQSDRNSMDAHKISKSKSGIYRPDRDSMELEQNREENSNKQKGKQQIRYTRFSGLTDKGNRQRSSEVEETLETNVKKLPISEKTKERSTPNFPDETITTASSNPFLRKRNLNHSEQLSMETFLDHIYRQSESTPSNSREIEKYVAQSRALRNSYTSIDSKNESMSEIFELKPEVLQRQDLNKGENSTSERTEAAVENFIKSSKYTETDENNQNLPINVSSQTKESRINCGKPSARPEIAGAIASPILSIESENSKCDCISMMKKLQKNRTGNCRPDCRGREFFCDQHCFLFAQIFQ